MFLFIEYNIKVCTEKPGTFCIYYSILKVIVNMILTYVHWGAGKSIKLSSQIRMNAEKF